MVPMELSNCINFLLTVAQHEVFLTFSERLSAFGITPGQYGVLNCLWSRGSATPKEIAQALHLENSTVSGILDKMEKRGLVDRVLDPNDSRSIRVAAIGEGEAIREGVLRTVEELNREILGRFTPEEAGQLLKLLRQLGTPTEQKSGQKG